MMYRNKMREESRGRRRRGVENKNKGSNEGKKYSMKRKERKRQKRE